MSVITHGYTIAKGVVQRVLVLGQQLLGRLAKLQMFILCLESP